MPIGRGGIAVLCLGVAAGAVVAQAPAQAPAPGRAPAAESGSWLGGLFGGKAEEKKDAAKPITPPTAAERQREYDQEARAFLRRQAVLDRLREVALETDNAELAEEADRLEDLAFKVFQKHSARLLGSGPAPLEAEPVSSEKARALLADPPARAPAPPPRRGPSPGFSPGGDR